MKEAATVSPESETMYGLPVAAMASSTFSEM